MTVSGDDVRQIFEPVMDDVNNLVMNQVRAVRQTGKYPKAVLIVGGFGQNAYLRERIRAVVAVFDVSVIQSPNGYVLIPHKICSYRTDYISWTAIVRGALMRDLATISSTPASVTLSGRRARKHYGVRVEREFIRGTHDGKHR